MATASASRGATTSLVGRLLAGIIGGLAGGVMFGVLMQMMGMIAMVAMLVGSQSAAVGWLVHLAISAFFGAVFALALSAVAKRVVSALFLGLGYGVVVWVVGALLIMPAWLGMPVFQFGATAWQSLMGHLVFGLVLGIVYPLVAPRLRRA